MARRLLWIEAARTIICALVVFAHVNIYTRAGLETWWPAGTYGAAAYSLSVPAFFIIAGYFTATASSARIARLALPFITWNLITHVVLVTHGVSTDSLAVDLVTGTWQLYFIFALLQLVMIYRLVARRLDASTIRRAAAIAIAITVISYALSEALLWLNAPDNGTVEANFRKLFAPWIGFFFLGVWWAHRRSTDIGISKFLVAVLFIAAFAAYVADVKAEEAAFGFTPRKQLLLGGLPFQLIGSLALLAILQRLEQTAFVRMVAPFGRDTYGIYLAHVSALILLYRVITSAGLVTMRSIEVVVIGALTIGICLVFVRVVRATRISILKLLLLGERR